MDKQSTLLYPVKRLDRPANAKEVRNALYVYTVERLNVKVYGDKYIKRNWNQKAILKEEKSFTDRNNEK